MTKNMKAAFRVVMVVLILAYLLVSPAWASAAKTKCYTISSGKTTVYENSSLTRKKGSVSGSDELTVLSVSRKHSKISWKGADGKTKKGYISTKAILLKTDGTSCKVHEKVKTCRRPGGKTCSSVSAGSKVTVLGTKGKYTQIRYTRSGSARYAFVKTSNLKAAR